MEHSGHCSANRVRTNLKSRELTKSEQVFLNETLQKIYDLKFAIMPLENRVLADLYDSYLRAQAHDAEIKSFEKYLYMRA
jgi:hypothetical protein